MPRLCRSIRFLRRPASVMSPSWVMSSTPSTDVGCMILREASCSRDRLCSWRRSKTETTVHFSRSIPGWECFYAVWCHMSTSSFCTIAQPSCLPFPHRSPVTAGQMVLLWPALQWVPRYPSPPKPNPPEISEHSKRFNKYTNIVLCLMSDRIQNLWWVYYQFSFFLEWMTAGNHDGTSRNNWMIQCFMAGNILIN